MIIFPVFSTAVFCLWALLLASAPTYTSILIIPILVSPVLTPLLSPADGPTILILSDVCVGTVAITLPTCNPVDAPVPINPSVVPDRDLQRVFKLTVLVLGCVGIALYTKGTTQPVDWAGSITSVPSDHPARPQSIPPTLREVGPGSNWTPLSQFDPPCPLHRQAIARNAGVSASGRVSRPPPADSGYQGSPLLSRRAASKQNQSRLLFVTVADPSSTPLFNHTEHQGFEGGWLSYVATDNPFWARQSAFRHRNDQVSRQRDSTPLDLLDDIVVGNLKAPSRFMDNTPPLSPLPLKSHIRDTPGFQSIPRTKVPIRVERTGVSDRESAREARAAFLRLQAERGYAAPSRLYHEFDNGMSTPSPARSPNIQALRDLLDSGRARLRRLSERRLAQPTSPNTHSPSISRPSTVERRASSIVPTPSAASWKSFKSSEQGFINLEENTSMLGLPADLSMSVGADMAVHKADDGPSHPVPPFDAVLDGSRKGASKSTLGILASTSADVGLRLLLQAIDQQGERSLYSDSEISSEVAMSVSLTLGEPPSFLDDIPDLPVSHPPQLVVVTKDQDTYSIPHFPTPIVAAVSPDISPEDAAIANPPLSPIPHNPTTPLPSTLPFTTSLSFGRIGGFLRDILETPVHLFSRPAPTSDDPHDLVPSSSLDGLKLEGDLPWLMDQTIPPSTIESRSGSPIPLFEKVISRVRAQKAATATLEDQLHATARNPEMGSVGEPGKLETSMSLERISNFLTDIWASPVRKFSNRARFERSRSVNPPTFSAGAIHTPEHMPYLVNRSAPSSLVESSSSPATSTSSKNLVQNFPGRDPPPDVHPTASKSHSLLDLGSPCVSGPFYPSSASSCSRSIPSTRSFTMGIPKTMSSLCEESLAGLDATNNP